MLLPRTHKYTYIQAPFLQQQRGFPTDDIYLITSVIAKLQELVLGGHTVTLSWILSHTNIIGNGIAGQLTLSASYCSRISVVIPPSLSQLQKTIHRIISLESRLKHLVCIQKLSFSHLVQ